MNPHVIRADDLIGLPVVTITSGEDVAEVRDVVYNAEEHSLIGFTLNERGFFAGRRKDVLPASALAAIGPDAIMIDDEAAITETGTPGALARPSDAASVIGNRVLTADGNELGTVVGVIVAAGPAPAAVGYEVDTSDGDDHVFVPISAQLGLSEKNLLLPEDATDFVRNDLAGFGAAVASFRSTTLDQETS